MNSSILVTISGGIILMLMQKIALEKIILITPFFCLLIYLIYQNFLLDEVLYSEQEKENKKFNEEYYIMEELNNFRKQLKHIKSEPAISDFTDSIEKSIKKFTEMSISCRNKFKNFNYSDATDIIKLDKLKKKYELYQYVLTIHSLFKIELIKIKSQLKTDLLFREK